MTPSPPRNPSLFVPHGAPTFALRPGAAGAALTRLANTLHRPRAIVMVSPHWETEIPTIGSAERFDTIHDFYGFPAALYDLRYPATGCPEAADQVASALKAHGFSVQQDPQRGLDHGAWVPLRFMFPDADIPIIPLSVQSQASPAYHFQLGQALAPLVKQGFLVIGSGSITHNLRDFQLAIRQGGQTPAYVRAFADWVADQVTQGQQDALLDYRQRAPHATQAHPTEEHLLPFFVALGAAGETGRGERFHAGIDDYVIAMDGYAFQPIHESNSGTRWISSMIAPSGTPSRKARGSLRANSRVSGRSRFR